MQNQTTLRTDAEIKKQFSSICKDFGMSANTLINVFMKTVIRERRIPFEITLGDHCHVEIPNEVSAKAFEEARKHKGVEKVELRDFDSFVDSI